MLQHLLSDPRPAESQGPGCGSLHSRLCHHSATGFASLAASSCISISFHWTNCLDRSRVWTMLLRKETWKLQGGNQSTAQEPLAA